MRSDLGSQDDGHRRTSRSLTQALVDNVSESIRSGTYRPGHRLPPEAQLALKQGVSRTVVREALSRLRAEGFIETRHGIGTFVREGVRPLRFSIEGTDIPTLRDVLAMLELRIGVESEAANLAAARRSEEDLAVMRRALDSFNESVAEAGDAVKPDFDFHLQVAAATGNRYFMDIMSLLGTTAIPRSRVRVAASGLNEYLRALCGEHEAIYRAILAREPAAAQTMMRVHLTASRERLRRASEAVETQAPSA